MAPSITSTCVECGMEKGHSLLYCPTCTLVKNQQKQFEEIQRNQTAGAIATGPSDQDNDFIYFLIALVGIVAAIVWGFSDMGYWESVGVVVTAPFKFLYFMFINIVALVTY